MSAQSIKLMSYNIGFAAGLDGLNGTIHDPAIISNNLATITSVINDYNPDILAVQEIDIHSKRSCYIDQIQYIQDHCQFSNIHSTVTWDCPYVLYPISFDFTRHFGRTKAAQAIFSKFPITNSTQVTFPKPRHNPWWYNYFYINRVAQYADILLPTQQPITIVNIHLDAYHPIERTTQTQQLLHTLPTHPHIICGDFNAISHHQQQNQPFPDEPKLSYDDTVIQTFSNHFKQDPPEFLTFPANAPNRQLDHIFTSSEFKVTHYKTVPMDIYPSDHLPITVDILF